MISPDYIKGYIAALRTTEIAFESIFERYNNFAEDNLISSEHYSGATNVIKEMFSFVNGQREAYKDLVTQLNEQIEKNKK